MLKIGGKARLGILFFTLFLFLIFPLSCKKSGTTEQSISKRQETKETPAKKKIMYRSTMNPKEISDKPGKDSMGMEMVPFEVEEQPAPKKKILYKSTMNPNEISDKPGKDSMGMEMVPFEVEEGVPTAEVAGRISVKISPERQQMIGVKSEVVKYQSLRRMLNIVGRVDYVEPNVVFVNLKFEGWVEKLYVDSTGKMVKKGEPLLDIYSPDLVSSQQEYLLAMKARKSLETEKSAESGLTMIKSAREKLRLWGITDKQIEDLEKTGEVKIVLTIYAPGSGFVIEKNVLRGQKIMAGENLYKIADLSKVWILGEIYEYELPFIKIGQEATISLAYLPGKPFAGKITYIYPFLNPETRTNKIRIEVANPGFQLKPEMYANLEIQVDYGTKLTVPESAVLNAGDKKIAFVDKGDGYLEPREIKVGVKGEDVYEVLEGLSEGEKVVTSAGFLVDSESSLKAALSQMIKGASGDHKHD